MSGICSHELVRWRVSERANAERLGVGEVEAVFLGLAQVEAILGGVDVVLVTDVRAVQLHVAQTTIEAIAGPFNSTDQVFYCSHGTLQLEVSISLRHKFKSHRKYISWSFCL